MGDTLAELATQTWQIPGLPEVHGMMEGA